MLNKWLVNFQLHADGGLRLSKSPTTLRRPTCVPERWPCKLFKCGPTGANSCRPNLAEPGPLSAKLGPNLSSIGPTDFGRCRSTSSPNLSGFRPNVASARPTSTKVARNWTNSAQIRPIQARPRPILAHHGRQSSWTACGATQRTDNERRLDVLRT